jgi:hypothetical protein
MMPIDNFAGSFRSGRGSIEVGWVRVDRGGQIVTADGGRARTGCRSAAKERVGPKKLGKWLTGRSEVGRLGRSESTE